MPIKMDFRFNGMRYDSFYVSTNGLVALTNRRYFYNDQSGARMIPSGATSCYDPNSMDWFFRGGRVGDGTAVEFLLLDAEFPRAVRYCIGLADGSLHSITGTRAGAFSCASEQRIGMLRSELDYAQAESIFKAGLHEFFDALQTKMNTIDECILGDFFAQRPQSANAAA